LARHLAVRGRQIIEVLPECGETAKKTPGSSINSGVADKVRIRFGEDP
jgi:hypothetical protein